MLTVHFLPTKLTNEDSSQTSQLAFWNNAIQMAFSLFKPIDNLPIPAEEQTMLFVSISTGQFFRAQK